MTSDAASPRWAVLVPARWGSTRLEAKALLAESGTPLVRHVQARAEQAPGVEAVVVLTDDERIERAVRALGGDVMLTSAHHASGTDRCAEAAATMDVDVVVNVQGDEPLFDPRDLAALAAAAASPDADMATLAHAFETTDELASPNAVKALVGADGFATDFRRVAPEGTRPGAPDVRRHVGIYAFRRERLLAFTELPPTPRERDERLEQLRALGHGWRIRVLEASAPAFGVDTREDYDRFLDVVGRAPSAG